MASPRSRQESSPPKRFVTRAEARALQPGANDALPPGQRMDSFEDVARWRDARRSRLRAERAALGPESRTTIAAAIRGRLEELVAALFGSPAGRGIVCYRPFRGEIDLTGWMTALHAEGAVVAVPQARSRHEPLVFRRWLPDVSDTGCLRYTPGSLPEGAEVEAPELVVAPLLGWDGGGFRLGYGTGSFDRTLSRLAPGTVTVGVGLQAARLETIHPQPFDIRLRFVVTEAATLAFAPATG